MFFIGIASIYYYFTYFYTPDGVKMNLQEEGIKIVQEAENSLLEEYNIEILKENTLIEKKKDPYELVQFMFSSVYHKKPSFFSQAFLAEQFFEDIIKVQEEVAGEIQGEDGELYFIDKISREGKLVDVKHIKTTDNFFKGTAEVKIELLYSDNKNIVLTLKLKSIKTGEKNKSSNYFITTSLWEIIDKIENAGRTPLI